MSTIDLLPHGMADMFIQATNSGALTLADRYTIKMAVLKESLSDEERQVIDRLLYAIRKGRVRLVS